MYCGSCMHAGTLAAVPSARHDVTLLPLYTPCEPMKKTGASTFASGAERLSPAAIRPVS